MNSATATVLDEMVLGEHAKRMLGAIGEGNTMMLCLIYKKLGAAKMIDEYVEPIGDVMASEMNLVRMALAQCEVPLRRQEEVIAQTVRRVAVIFVGYVDKLCKGEPLDDEHAEFVAGMKAVTAAETVPDKMRAFADMLEKRSAAPETREASAVRDAMRNRGKYTA